MVTNALGQMKQSAGGVEEDGLEHEKSANYVIWIISALG